MYYRISMDYKKYDYSINLRTRSLTEALSKYKAGKVKDVIQITEEEYICGLLEELRSTLIKNVIGQNSTVLKLVEICGGAT
ncbi:hypothetical protein [Mesotoga prima]|uniref:hypothetical protein n=1 Tax=Mesotoga prima TaxID=1184387 RepID=UPI002FDA490C